VPSRRVFFTFVLHAHQPVGQSDEVFERVFNNSYWIVPELLRRFEGVRLALHFSGPLLEWLVRQKPEYVDAIRSYVKENRVELLSGGFYEPVLALWPRLDGLIQLWRMREYLKQTFGVTPRGAWLTERVWEPEVIPVLADAGIEYVLVDDYVLRRAALSEEACFYAYSVEAEQRRLTLLPINQQFRYLTPWKPPEEALQYLQAHARPEGARIIVGMGDVEKYGEWGRDREYGIRWLTSFFKLLAKEPIVELVLPSEYLRRVKPRRLLYTPSGSYDKMVRWSGGWFRNFLMKYPDANRMHKRVLYARRWVLHAVAQLLGTPRHLPLLEARLQQLLQDPQVWRNVWKAIEQFYDPLLQAECNDAYWHGLFGGVYISGLRRAIYQVAAKAEAAARYALRLDTPSLDRYDYDFDGHDELIVHHSSLTAFIDPGVGGTIVILEHDNCCLTDVLMRRREPYHGDQYVPVDWHLRGLFTEHVLRAGTSPEAFAAARPFLDISDLAIEPWQVDHAEADRIRLSRLATLWVTPPQPLAVTKEYRFDATSVTATLTARYRGTLPLNTPLLTELNLLVGGSPSVIQILSNHTRLPTDRLYVGKVETLLLKGPWATVRVTPNPPVTAWLFPISPLANTERGPKPHYQGHCIALMVASELSPGKEYRLEARVEVEA